MPDGRRCRGTPALPRRGARRGCRLGPLRLISRAVTVRREVVVERCTVASGRGSDVLFTCLGCIRVMISHTAQDRIVSLCDVRGGRAPNHRYIVCTRRSGREWARIFRWCVRDLYFFRDSRIRRLATIYNRTVVVQLYRSLSPSSARGGPAPPLPPARWRR